MKYSVPVSVFAHVLIGASGLLVWNSPLTSSTEVYIDVPLDIVSLAEETNIREVIRPAPKPEPKPEAQDIEEEEGQADASEPEPDTKPVVEEPEVEDVPPLADPEEEEPPVAEPKKEEPKKEEPKKEEPKKKPPATQKRNEAEVKKNELDDLFNDAEDLLKNLDTKPKKREQRETPQELEDQQEPARRGAGDRTGAQVNVVDLVKAHIIQSDCKRSIKDLPGWENLDVSVTFRLDSKGRVSRAPKVTKSARPIGGDIYMKAAAESALRSITFCEPYPLPEEQYDLWQNQDIILNFDETF